MERTRLMGIMDRGNIIKANTPSGRRQREAAMEGASVGIGRDASGKLAKEIRFRDKVGKLKEVAPVRLGKEDIEKLDRMAVFYRGSKEHRVVPPDATKGEKVRRTVWNPVVGEAESGMKIVDSVDGMRVRGEDIWLVPREESLRNMGRGDSVQWIYEMLDEVDRTSEKSTTRQKVGGGKIVVLDGEGSKHVPLGTNVVLCGRGLKTSMQGLELGTAEEEFY